MSGAIVLFFFDKIFFKQIRAHKTAVDSMIKKASTAASRLILYADDDAEDRLLMNLAFHEGQLQVRLKIFEDGVQLLHYLSCNQGVDALPSLIVLDINMPMLSGKDILRILRSMDSHRLTPVVLFTTSSTPEDKFFAREFNASFITKPLHLDEMETVLATFLKICTIPFG